MGFRVEEHQMAEVWERVKIDRELANSNVCSRLWNAAYETAFRSANGLGNSPLSELDYHEGVTADNLFRFYASAMARLGHLLAVDGTSQSEVVELARTKFFQPFPTVDPALAPKLTSSPYYGGECRLPSAGRQGGDGRNYVMVAFGTGGALEPAESMTALILTALLPSNAAAVKYAPSICHLPEMAKLLEKHKQDDLTIRTDHEECQTGGLLAITLAAAPSLNLKPVMEVLCGELRALAATAPSAEILMAAKARASNRRATQCEHRLGSAHRLAQQVALAVQQSQLLAGASEHQYQVPTLAQELTNLRAVSTADFRAMASKILSRRPTVVSLGNLRQIPYADEISF